MAMVVTYPTQLNVGDTLVITGAGATASGSIKIEVSSEAEDSLSVVGHVTASGGAFTTVGALDIVVNSDEHLNVKVTDITAVLSDSKRIEVFTQGQ